MNAVTPRPSETDAIWQKLKPHKFIALFAFALIVFFVIALIVILIVKPGATKAPCGPGKNPCGTPPTLPQATAGAPFVAGRVWKSSGLGFSLEYDPSRWKVASQNKTGVSMSWSIPSRPDLDLTLIVQGVPLSQLAPAQLLNAQINALKGDVLGLKADTSPKHALLGPDIGYVDQNAVGGAYAGTLDTPQGPGPRIALLSMASTDGKIALVATAATTSPEEIKLALMNEADSVLNTVHWPTNAENAGRRRLALAPLERKVERSQLISAKASDKYLGPTDPKKQVSFSLVLRFRQAALDRYLAQVSDPKSPLYGKYLTAKEIGERYGISDAAVARVKARLKAAGLQVNVVYPQRTSIRATGTVAQVSRFFRTSLGNYKDSSGRVYYKPLRNPSIPAAIRRSVVGVTGLSTKSVPLPAAVPGGGLTPKLTAKAYNIAPLHAAGINGQGMNVAIVSFDSFNDSDPRNFDRRYGLSGPPVKHVRPFGPVAVGDGASEVNLDIDTIRSIAPKAQILDFEAPNGGVGYGDVINAIIKDGRANIVSISWGNCDDVSNLSPDERTATEQAFKAAVARGLSIFVASGDAGAYTCQRRFLEDHRLTTEFPSNTPYTISVGGTRLSTTASGAYAREYGWEDPLGNGGGGGGLNPKDPRPAWQKGPGVVNKFSNGKRQLPDVSASADPDSGFWVVTGGEAFPIGGTSAATPFWAGSMTLISQLAKKNHVGSGANKTGKLGFVAPILYQLAAKKQPFPPFHDVVAGGNRFYDATPGWDFSTGLGSPDVWNLARDMVRYLRTH
jgi:kumamolisin